jgi:Flp pilus assembly protein TadD
MTPTDQSALTRARALLDLHRYDEALGILGPLVASEPDNPQPRLLMALALSGTGRPQDALDGAERACALAPEHAYAHRLRAMILLELKRNREARKAAERSVELDPHAADSQWVLARAALAGRDVKTAKLAAVRVGELAPGSALGFHARGFVLLYQRKWVAAEAEYRQACALSPQDPALLNNLGAALLHQGRSEEATELFVRAGREDVKRPLYLKNTAVAARQQMLGGRVSTFLRFFRGRSGFTRVLGLIAFSLFVVAAWGAVAALAQNPMGRAIELVGIVAVVLVVRRRRRALSEPAKRALDVRRRDNRAHYRRLPRFALKWFCGGLVVLILFMVIANFFLLK